MQVEPQEYFKLSTLTNLEKIRFRELPVELLQHFPRMKLCDNTKRTYFSATNSPELIRTINTYCPHYQYMRVTGDLLSMVPLSVTNLNVSDVSENSLEALSRLTNLKKVEIWVKNTSFVVDLRHITWLEKIHIDTTNVIGLEYSHQLTELVFSEQERRDVSTLLESLTALPKLHKLKMFHEECNVTLPALTRLTSLLIDCQKTNTGSLPTTLLELDLKIRTPAFKLRDLSHLVHLTRLSARKYKKSPFIYQVEGVRFVLEFTMQHFSFKTQQSDIFAFI